MQYKCKVRVLEKKCFVNLQQRYLEDPESGPCPFYQEGDEFVFERYGGEDTFWTMGKGAHCSEAWDCISRYIYTALQGGSIMRNWTKDEHVMIACCNDGTRPVIFKIERLDYYVVRTDRLGVTDDELIGELEELHGVKSAVWRADKQWWEIFTDRNDPVSKDDIIKKFAYFGTFVIEIE